MSAEMEGCRFKSSVIIFTFPVNY